MIAYNFCHITRKYVNLQHITTKFIHRIYKFFFLQTIDFENKKTLSQQQNSNLLLEILVFCKCLLKHLIFDRKNHLIDVVNSTTSLYKYS